MEMLGAHQSGIFAAYYKNAYGLRSIIASLCSQTYTVVAQLPGPARPPSP